MPPLAVVLGWLVVDWLVGGAIGWVLPVVIGTGCARYLWRHRHDGSEGATRARAERPLARLVRKDGPSHRRAA